MSSKVGAHELPTTVDDIRLLFDVVGWLEQELQDTAILTDSGWAIESITYLRNHHVLSVFVSPAGVLRSVSIRVYVDNKPIRGILNTRDNFHAALRTVLAEARNTVS